MPTNIISAQQQKRSAQAFSFFSCIAVLIPVLIPIWIAASIFTYAAIANHPNPLVRDVLRFAGYRFYGLIGMLVVVLNFSHQLAKWVGGGLHLGFIIWGIAILVVIPLGVRDVVRAQTMPWQDMAVDLE